MEGKQDIKMPANLRPIYADEANVNANVKVNIEKDKDGNEIIRKSGKVDMLFFDQFTRSVISRIVIDPFTAKVLSKMLADHADKLIEELDKTDVPDQVKKRLAERDKNLTKNSSVDTYIG